MTYQNMFSNYRPKVGKAWLLSVSEEDRKVFGRIGLSATIELGINIWSIGGKARSVTAKRDSKGRFIKC